MSIEKELTISEIRKNLAQEHHWEQQEKHFTSQQKYWRWVATLGAIAVIANALKPLWSN